MVEFVIEPAQATDEAAIRRLLASSPVPGQITATYEREPDYFLGCGTMGHFWQVIVGRHLPSGQLAGVACRARRPLFINGRVEEVNYLSQLRVAHQFQGRWLVSQGFDYLRQLERGERPAGTIATIIEGGAEAAGILVKRPRPHFPQFREVGRLWTLALILRRSRVGWPRPRRICQLESGSATSLPELVDFLRQHGAAKQFFPVYSEADFQNSPLTPGFRLEDFILARRQGQLVGLLGLWDQSSYKQTVVQSYGGSLGRYRFWYNLGLRLMGARPLPVPGERVHYAFASFICIAGNNPEIFGELLERAYELAAGRGYAYLMVGLMASDPLLAVARHYWHIPYRSRLYTVCWPEQANWPDRLDGRPQYLEAAAL